MNTIGIAVPCYIHHFDKLKRMLDSIEKNTMKPHQVVISCSSMNNANVSLDEDKYSFPIKIIYHNERLNAAQNRNIASSHLNTDIISFFDADDIMHPQRIESIYNAFNTYDCKIVLHSYSENREQSFEKYETIHYEYGVLMKAPSGCAIVKYNWQLPIHHSQVSVSKDIMLKLKFNESSDHERKEDAIFCGLVLSTEPERNVYIKNELSQYDYAGVWL